MWRRARRGRLGQAVHFRMAGPRRAVNKRRASTVTSATALRRISPPAAATRFLPDRAAMPRVGTNEVIMTTTSMKVLAAFSFLALASSPALATEDRSDSAMYPTHMSATTAAPTDAMKTAQSGPQAQAPTRSAQNARTAQSAASVLMFEKPFQKWWTED
jgi:hypothetical protein